MNATSFIPWTIAATPGALLLLAALGWWLYRLGRLHGVRRCLADCRKAYDLGLRDGRREERHEPESIER